jgi:acyl-CoA synthetase (AMP-forming)/AMP-acid ligase II
MGDPTTIRALLDGAPGSATAIAAPGRSDLAYGELRAHVDRTIVALSERGIGRGDRVAIVLPNGPEMATAFLSIASAASTAPLNPEYRTPEFEFYLSDLRARALVVQEGFATPAEEVATGLGIEVLRIRPRLSGPAGLFDLSRGATGGNGKAKPAYALPDDEALVLHTSGTTARPKIVPLLHRNVCASARNISTTLHLTPEDRCMNVMPLFHVHGLMACLLSSLHSGGSVSCTPGFEALKFFSWLDEARPTWYSAAPTLHQAVLARSAHNPRVIERTQLRFIRSSSAALPPQVMSELEATFGVPVVEAYAMTEAAHQMTSNALPPGSRKPGSVGPAAGPEVAIMDEAGALLSPGQVGEIVVRGENLTPGYERNAEANAAAFTDGWFRTGDQGYLDDEAHLTITGRLKEIINRGGEKISPREVDEVLLDHAAVAQAVTFAMPHPMLGEEVAAAVVLVDGAAADEREIREFAAMRLATFKVPKRVLILSDIPKGPTGKLRRIGLAEVVGLA